MAQTLDFCLRCNTLTCRATLTERAVVTTCSHIFCLTCADHAGLSRSSSIERQCPACQSNLHNPDDVVSTTLNPTEDYKTSVLSGLDPNTVMECAGRALAFWAYQSAQEIYYQDHRGKSLTNKCATLSKQMDQMAQDANSEIENLQHRISGIAYPVELSQTNSNMVASIYADLEISQQQLQKKNQELVEVYRDKCRKHTQITNMYNLLKSRAMRSQIQTAVSDSVEKTFQSMGASIGSPGAEFGPHRPITSLTTPLPNRHDQYPGRSNLDPRHQQQRNNGTNNGPETVLMPPPSGLPVSYLNSNGGQPTTQHRTRLLPPRQFTDGPQQRQYAEHSFEPPNRPSNFSQHPELGVSSNDRVESGQGNYGFSPGMKIGRPTSHPLNGPNL